MMTRYQRRPENGNLPVCRGLSSDYHSREYLTVDGVTRLIEVAKVLANRSNTNTSIFNGIFTLGRRSLYHDGHE